MLITDPPYFLPINSYVGTRENGYSHRTLADTSILKGYFKNVFNEIDRVIKTDGTYYVFCDAQSYPVFYQVLFPFCKHVRLLIWDKMISYNGYTWRHQHELICWGEKDKTKRIATGDGDVIQCRGVLQKKRNHPAEKPIEIIRKLILKHKEPAGNLVVLDPYIGSGTTALACRNVGVNFIGFELDEQFFNQSVKRISECNKQSLFIQMNNPLNTIVQSDEQTGVNEG